MEGGERGRHPAATLRQDGLDVQCELRAIALEITEERRDARANGVDVGPVFCLQGGQLSDRLGDSLILLR